MTALLHDIPSSPTPELIAGTLGALDVELTRRAEKSLATYIRQSWPIIEPGTEYLHNWHIDAMSENLEAVTRGQIHRLLINIPPRYMKSICVSVNWPTWEWQLDPASRWLFSSYSDDLSLKHSVDRRIIIQSKWYQDRWGASSPAARAGKPHVALIKDQNEKGEFQNTHRGVMVATSMRGSATGKGGNRIVIDDPHNPKGAESEVEREGAIRNFDQTFTNRLNDKRRGAIVIVMQRLHHNDLSGHVLAQRVHGAPVYTHLCLPCPADEPQTISFPRTGRVMQRKAGDLLWPEREGPREIATARVAMGSYAFAGQYGQRPSPAGGGRFKRSWFQYVEDAGEYLIYHRRHGDALRILKTETWKFQTVDLALSLKEEACYSVIATWVVNRHKDCLLADIHRERLEAPDAEVAMRTAYMRHSPMYMAVEKAHYGVAVIQKFLREGLPIKELIADRDKLTRSMTASVLMEAGKIFFLKGAPWLGDYESELLFFPRGDHDDQVDVTSYAAIVMAADGAMSASDIIRGRTMEEAIPLPGAIRGARRARWEDVTG